MPFLGPESLLHRSCRLLLFVVVIVVVVVVVGGGGVADAYLQVYAEVNFKLQGKLLYRLMRKTNFAL
jgi:hypothetical protein